MEPFNLTGRQIAKLLNVAPSTFKRILSKNTSVSPEMALRLPKVFGRTPESWLIMQNAYSLSKAKENIDLSEVRELI